MFEYKKKKESLVDIAFRRETRTRLVTDTGNAILASFFMYPIFIPVDYLVYPLLAETFLLIRVVVVVLGAGVFVILKTPFGKNNPTFFSVFTYLYGALAIVLMVHLSEGYASPYYAGISLVFICLLFILPMNARATAILAGVVYGSYIIPIAIVGNITDIRAFAGNNSFLVSTMVLSVLSSYMASVMRRKEFASRYDLARANQDLVKLDAVKSRFFASISHEIRTPLTSIMAPTDSLRRGDVGELSPVQKSLIDQTYRNTLRLLDLINQMLDFAKFDAGKMKLHLKRVDVARLIQNHSSLFSEVCSRKGLFLDCKVSENIPVIYLDQEKVERIISNLIRNAIKFTENGGITLSADLVTESGVMWIVFSVKDTGIGISEDDLGLIFERFHQIDSAETRRFEGTGLGLSIVRESIDLQHGRIGVTSTAGAGSTFTVHLPTNLDVIEPDAEIDRRAFDRRQEDQVFVGQERRENPRRLGDSEAVSVKDLALIEAELISSVDVVPIDFPEPKPKTGIRVLYIEDNADLRRFVSLMLGGFGHTVSVAENGAIGWSMVQEILPDIIISDVMMPGMSGLEVAKLVKITETTQRIPIILITAKSEMDARIEGFETGADDYLGKPINMHELDARICNIVRDRRFRDALVRAEEVSKRSHQLAEGLALSLELRDGYTAGHSNDVLFYGTLITEELGIPMDQTLRDSLLLHDIGKMGITDVLLRKPAPLTPEEWKEMRKHPQMGSDLLKRFDSLEAMNKIVLSHHERYDGLGYPSGLSGDDIPLGSRIIAVADSWHAMTEDRTYRSAIPVDGAVSELIGNRGKQFDPKIVDCFLAALVRKDLVSAAVVEREKNRPRR